MWKRYKWWFITPGVFLFVIYSLGLLAFFGVLAFGTYDAPCPNGYSEGDVVTHLTGNYQAIILDCWDGSVDVDLGNGTVVNWDWNHVREFLEGI